MIAVSVMLAIFLVWPLVFGHSAAPVDAAPAQAHSLASGRAELALVDGTGKPLHAASARKPESCYHRYQREVAACSVNSAACRLSVADRWDLCEATGFWPQ
jgi:hypothetical protein